MIALISIPHQKPPKIYWYNSEQDLIDDAEWQADVRGGLIDEHGFDDPAVNAAHEIGDDWHGTLLIRTDKDVDDLKTYTGHQYLKVRALAAELIEEFMPEDAKD